MTDRPTRIWRVEYEAALGWPDPDERRNTYRHCFTAAQAGQQLAIIAAMPSHLKLHRVLVTTNEIAWEEVDPASLPVPDLEGEPDGVD